VPLTHLHWAAVLKGCHAFEAYQRRRVGRIEPERVVEFLLLEPTFPRSVRFCLEAVASALEAIEGAPAGRELHQTDRRLGLMLGELKYLTLDEILAGDLRAFLGRLSAQLVEVSRAVQERYSLR
jgi:uncharacterized alpha-E superfamily protein